MAKTFLVFNFGSDEETAQRARLRIEAWKQAFRLGNKIQFKVERAAPADEKAEHSEQSSSKSGEGSHAGKKDQSSKKENGRPIRALVRLDFSSHEKHLFQTWLARIPSEEPFRSAKPETIQQSSATFEETSDLFDSLD